MTLSMCLQANLLTEVYVTIEFWTGGNSSETGGVQVLTTSREGHDIFIDALSNRGKCEAATAKPTGRQRVKAKQAPKLLRVFFFFKGYCRIRVRYPTCIRTRAFEVRLHTL